jgi:hypothetical protein
LDCICIIRW